MLCCMSGSAHPMIVVCVICARACVKCEAHTTGCERQAVLHCYAMLVQRVRADTSLRTTDNELGQESVTEYALRHNAAASRHRDSGICSAAQLLVKPPCTHFRTCTLMHFTSPGCSNANVSIDTRFHCDDLLQCKSSALPQRDVSLRDDPLKVSLLEHVTTPPLDDSSMRCALVPPYT